ncbi:hypothetical protein [Streptomyces erythrochromogenes]
MEPLPFPGNPPFRHETLRPRGRIAYGGADFGEWVAACAARAA